MDFNNLWQRADLKAIRAFLKYGTEEFTEISQKPYPEQIRNVEHRITEFLEKELLVNKEKDKNYLNEQMTELENIYFEIGLLMGAKIAFQIAEKIKFDYL